MISSEGALACEAPLQPDRLRAQSFGRLGVRHRLGREAGVDHEEPQVVVAELAEAQLGERR